MQSPCVSSVDARRMLSSIHELLPGPHKLVKQAGQLAWHSLYPALNDTAHSNESPVSFSPRFFSAYSTAMVHIHLLVIAKGNIISCVAHNLPLAYWDALSVAELCPGCSGLEAPGPQIRLYSCFWLPRGVQSLVSVLMHKFRQVSALGTRICSSYVVHPALDRFQQSSHSVFAAGAWKRETTGRYLPICLDLHG